MDLSLPCKKLCEKRWRGMRASNPEPMNRFHLTCLTCLDRRYHYNKINREDFIRLSEGDKFAMVNVYSPMVLPKNCRWYCLIINEGGGFFKYLFKNVFLRFLLSVAEVIANW